MNSPRKKIIFPALLWFLLFISPVSASTPEPPAAPRDYVVDLAGVMNGNAETRLNGVLRELEQKTTAQVLVLTVDTLDGEEIRSFGLRIAEKWKLGQKGKDNGALLVIAVKDRQYTLETGYGLESILPDSMVGSLGRQYLVPNFRKGDYSTGIYTAALAVADTIASAEGVSITGLDGSYRRTENTGNGKPLGPFQIIVLGILGVIVLILFITNPHMCFLILLSSAMGGRGGGGWSGGRGGGFGGGGGGGFGGGGASGRW
jgi:uncharacterized protein